MKDYYADMVKRFEEKHGRKPDKFERTYMSTLAQKIQYTIDTAEFDFEWFNATGEMDFTK